MANVKSANGEPDLDHLPHRGRFALTRDKAASTFIRLGESQHVADLRLIFWTTCTLMLTGSIFVVTWHKWVDASGVIGSSALITAIVGTGFGVLAWTYQTGSARLGIVDLFGCEITTICRVIAIVETAPRYAELYRNPPPYSINFNSQENYSPVFDSNNKDLEVLEARVVERVTEFYTYLKAMRDYLRILSSIGQPGSEIDRWHMGMRSVIYMLFLMLESARKSVDRLVEFEPERAQNTITILLSELVAYGLLSEVFEEDALQHPGYNARTERLRLRRDDYVKLVSSTYWRAHYHRNDKDWQGAAALIGELNHRYHDAFGEWIDPIPASLPSENTRS